MQIFKNYIYLYSRKREIFNHCKNLPYLFLNKNKLLINIDISICTNSFGFSYASDGWHPITALLKELYVKNKEPDLFYKYFHSYQPTQSSHLPLLCGTNVNFSPEVLILPWGGFSRKTFLNGGTPLRKTSWLIGPLSEDDIALNINRTINVYKNIKSNGYRPWLPTNSFIQGVLLVKSNGDKRFVVTHGKHRVGVLSFLGYNTFKAQFDPNMFKIISENEISSWYYVKNGKCSQADAASYFNSFFILNGLERAREYNLL